MLSADVLCYDKIPEKHFRQIVERAVRYAVISIPFTFNRMGIDNLSQKIINVAKGKIAELMFRYFCVDNGIDADFETCQTPFYQPDKRDFWWKGKEWDIKNNFLYHQGYQLPLHQYLQLPALIPNQHQADQWQKRNVLYLEKSEGTGFLFTFLKNGNYYGENMMSIALTSRQRAYLLQLYQQYQGKAQTHAPFDELYFWQHCQPILIRIHHQPTLIITGYATHAEWHLFENSGNTLKKYLDGVLITRINNKFCLIEKLLPFRALMK